MLEAIKILFNRYRDKLYTYIVEWSVIRNNLFSPHKDVDESKIYTAKWKKPVGNATYCKTKL